MSPVARFLRAGGHGEITLRLGSGGPRTGAASAGSHAWQVKRHDPGADALRDDFRDRLDMTDREGGTWLRDVLRQDAGWTIAAGNLADGTAEADAALQAWDESVAVLRAEWGVQPDRFAAALGDVEDHLAETFAGRLNARRQGALGIDQYVWITQGDERVRSEHAALAGEVFDWDEPPPEGHPGEPFNCRCRAYPHLPDEPEWEPDTGPAHRARRLLAEGEGASEAAWDAAAQIVQGLLDLPGHMATAGRFVRLLGEEALDTLDPEEADELAGMRAAIDARVDEVEQLFRDSPEIAIAFRDYVVAVQDRPEMVEAAYRAGLATEAQLLEALRDRSYLNAQFLLAVVPATLPARALRLGRRDRDADDAASLADELAWVAAQARRHPSDVDWPVIDNPGIRWGGPIQEQGDPWEVELDSRRALGQRLPQRFRAIDFFDQEARTATSAKTLNTLAPTYSERPSRIYGQLREYVDKLARFERHQQGDVEVTAAMIDIRELALAVPFDTRPDQVVQIRRAIEYAEGRGIEMTVEFVR